MVNNLLDMARLQSGAVRLNRQWQPIEEVVGTALQSLQPALSSHHLQLQIPPGLPLLHLDAALMERVLGNLFENALKYTPSGSTLSISAELAPAAGQLKLRVSDNGPGLPPVARSSCSPSLAVASARAARPVWAWAWRSAAPSCKPMAARSTLRIFPAAAQALSSACRWGIHRPCRSLRVNRESSIGSADDCFLGQVVAGV